MIRGEYDMAGTFNGNPLTMAASRATLTEVLVPEAYEHFNRIDKVMKDGLDARSSSTTDCRATSPGSARRAR